MIWQDLLMSGDFGALLATKVQKPAGGADRHFVRPIRSSSCYSSGLQTQTGRTIGPAGRYVSYQATVHAHRLEMKWKMFREFERQHYGLSA